MRNWVIAIIVIILIVLGIWWWTRYNANQGINPPNTTAGLNGSPNQTNTGQANVPPVLEVATSPTLGDYLVANNGYTLYKYSKDIPGVSNCTGTCATNWPPYLSTSTEPLVSGTGITGLVSTIMRSDGTVQITYNGAPLYLWKNDTKPGDTKGEGIQNQWSVVKP